MSTFTWSDLRGDPRPSGNQLVYEHCPVCGHGGWKFYVNPDTGGWFCFAGSHNSGGFIVPQVTWGDCSMTKLLQQMVQEATAVAEWPEIEVPSPKPLGELAHCYLYRRGISPNYARILGLCESYCYPGRVVIPVFWRGTMVYWTARAYTDVYPKYLSAPGKRPLYVVLPEDNIPSPVVLVEGPFDAIRVAQAGYTGVALLGKTLPAHCRSILQFTVPENTPVKILLDNDQATAHAVRLANQLYGQFEDVRIHLLPNQYKDPGCTPVEVLRAVLR